MFKIKLKGKNKIDIKPSFTVTNEDMEIMMILHQKMVSGEITVEEANKELMESTSTINSFAIDKSGQCLVFDKNGNSKILFGKGPYDEGTPTKVR